MGKLSTSKSGRGTTVCALDGRLPITMLVPVVCTVWMAKREKLLWKKGGDNGVGYGSGGATGNRDVSAVAIGGRIILSRSGKMIGIDPETGEQLWQVDHASGGRGIPVKLSWMAASMSLA